MMLDGLIRTLFCILLVLHSTLNIFIRHGSKRRGECRCREVYQYILWEGVREGCKVPGSVRNFSFGSGHFHRRICQGVRSTHACL